MIYGRGKGNARRQLRTCVIASNRTDSAYRIGAYAILGSGRQENGTRTSQSKAMKNALNANLARPTPVSLASTDQSELH